MAFLHPWALAIGLLAAALPVLIHWLTRPRPVSFALSTVRFVLQAVQERRARHRLRDWIVLALRTAAVLLLAGAIARPLAARRAALAEESAGDATRVVVVDVSQSLAARSGGIQAFERARARAAGHLSFRPGLAANLVLAGASARAVFERPSTNFAALRDELGRAAPRPERLNAQAALNVAARILAETRGGALARRELVIVSDFQRTPWSTADFSALPREAVIHLESVAPAEPPPNLAILRVGGPGRAEAGRSALVEVEVGNYSPTPRQVRVELMIGDVPTPLEGTCAARSRTTLTAEVVPRAVGWHAGRARLVGHDDALAEDDARPFAIEVRPTPSHALLTRQAAGARPSSSYYLERALVPVEGTGEKAPGRVIRVDPTQLDGEALTGADLIALDHPGKLPEEVVRLLVGWARRGRGLLYVAAEPADAVNLRRIADAAGTDLRPPVEFTPPPPGQVRRGLFLADFRRDEAPFRVFGDGATAVLAPLRFAGGLASRPLPDALAEDVRATYGDRTACLVVTDCGAGTLAVLNADLGASSLATSPAFVPLMGELTAILLGRRNLQVPVACGEPFAVPLPADAGPATGLTIVPPAPSGGQDPGKLVEDKEGVLWRSEGAGAPGVTRVERDGHPVFALAAAIPEAESDLTPLAASVLQGRLLGGRTSSYRDASRPEDAADRSWAWLAVACVVCLGAELVALRAFRT